MNLHKNCDWDSIEKSQGMESNSSSDNSMKNPLKCDSYCCKNNTSIDRFSTKKKSTFFYQRKSPMDTSRNKVPFQIQKSSTNIKDKPIESIKKNLPSVKGRQSPLNHIKNQTQEKQKLISKPKARSPDINKEIGRAHV